MLARLILQSAILLVVNAALLFGAAGTLAWPAAWIFLIQLSAGGLLIGLWLARHDPGLLAERLSPTMQPGQEAWDKLFLVIAAFLWGVWLIGMGLDAGRFHFWPVPIWVQAIGMLALFLSLAVVFLTFRVNSFAAPVVKIQRERGHRVIADGPYRHVRHPMYAGAALLFLGVPLLLGSWYGLALAPLLTVGLAIRAVLEERTLARDLDGYADYAARVRCRLVPGIW